LLDGSLKSLGLLWANLATNQRYKSYTEEFDIRTFWRRLDNEGLTFITVVLPRIGKALDRFHSTSEWNPPEGFELRKDVPLDPNSGFGFPETSRIPVFLGKAIEAALNGDSIAVDCVRQLTLVFYKLEVDYGEEKELQFLARFRKTDQDLLFLFDSVDDNRDALIREMGCIIKRVLCNSDPLDIVPSHGSGATACRTPNWEKHHRALNYFEKLDNVYPYSDYFFFNHTHLCDAYERLENSLPVSVPRARVCLVPKDSRGPRVISCEPAEMMFIQQGIMRSLYDLLETHPLTSGYINFTNQTINRELAKSASKGETQLATIDLSDASDRVSLELVRRVFPSNWFEALEACRSEETILPNGEIVKLNKFAPMGSSCCFPVEALVFWACAVATIRILRKSRDFPHVYVYGDDIIIGSEFFEPLVKGLESIGLLVNRDKSYFKGPFRESCGGDFHFGVNVTPVMVRKYLSRSRTSVMTNSDLINHFVDKFGYADSNSLVSIIETAGGYVYPRSELQLPAVVRSTPCASNDVFFRRRFNKDLQRFEYRILTCISQSKERQPPNWEELFRKQLCKDRVNDRSSNDDSVIPYENPIAKLDAQMDPGWYTDTHSVVSKWVWTWLG
jgi:hypothetical protein